jgi:hypothetical protein
MKRKPHSTSLVLLLVCIFTFWWGISVLAQRDMVAPAVVANQVPTTANATAAATLVVTEAVAGGTHTYTGTYMPQSACDSFGSGIQYDGGGHVAILLITNPSSTACAQAAGANAGEPFSVSTKGADGSEPVFDGVLLNGVKIPSQLVQGV